ncbi:MAG: FIST signal transduction protein [Kofleriaceae bacterium]
MTREGSWVDGPPDSNAALVLVFGDGEALLRPNTRQMLGETFPTAVVAGCSTAGNIIGNHTDDAHLVVTTVRFEHSGVRGAIASFASAEGERAAGIALASELAAPDLVHLFVLSEGIGVNGTTLVSGLRDVLPDTPISGGLAGDGERMERTFVMLGDRVVSGAVVGVGFYGSHLRAGFGCRGGWQAFGPERRITRSTGNLLHELDGEPALALYRRYLGAAADGLPATGLLFPIEIRPPTGGNGTVRTLLGVEPNGVMRFAGDVPEGFFARLMTASTTNLLEGASVAASRSTENFGRGVDLAILVSCVGRRMVLGQRTDDELDSVNEALGNVPMTGFYSYGELSPTGVIGCDLHNQTMTLTTLYEVP